jgi:glutamine amidotransferase
MLVIVDYKMGNLGSVQNMLKKIGVASTISSDPSVIMEAHKLILPGVGNFERAMDNLNTFGLIDVLNKKVLVEKTPILGICLGMQLMTSFSEEGDVAGLGFIEANTVKFNDFQDTGLKVPHMGWNTTLFNNNHPIGEGLFDSRFYFVHSYKVICKHIENVMVTTNYGGDFHSGIMSDHIMGVQFHPEKSHKFGMRLLQNFDSIVIEAKPKN